VIPRGVHSWPRGKTPQLQEGETQSTPKRHRKTGEGKGEEKRGIRLQTEVNEARWRAGWGTKDPQYHNPASSLRGKDGLQGPPFGGKKLGPAAGTVKMVRKGTQKVGAQTGKAKKRSKVQEKHVRLTEE